MKAWERRMVGYRKNSKTYRIWESGTKIVESRSVTFIEILPVKLNTLDNDHNDGGDGNFLDLESSSISRGTQEDIQETEADAEPDIVYSRSGGTISNVDGEVIVTSTTKVTATLTAEHAKRPKQTDLRAN